MFGPEGLEHLIAVLLRAGYGVLGPRVEDGAVIIGPVQGIADLPSGWGDDTEAATYRLRRREDGAFFGFTLPAQGWKRFLHPPRHRLFSVDRATFTPQAPPPDPAPMAFLGARACELAAMSIQDTVLEAADPAHGERLRRTFVVAVECVEAGNTCFCGTMETGPWVQAGFDIKLVELAGPDRHVFLARANTPEGAEILAQVPSLPADPADMDDAHHRTARVERATQGRMDTHTAEHLKDFPEHPQWDDVAARCLTCGNCTMVCPTCFCTTTQDVTDLKGEHAERWREWDSCFSLDFSHLHGGSVRQSGRSRYRHWITHKLSTWIDQFGTSGCVGCGRCIVWCPVGIDITREVEAIRHNPLPGKDHADTP